MRRIVCAFAFVLSMAILAFAYWRLPEQVPFFNGVSTEPASKTTLLWPMCEMSIGFALMVTIGLAMFNKMPAERLASKRFYIPRKRYWMEEAHAPVFKMRFQWIILEVAAVLFIFICGATLRTFHMHQTPMREPSPIFHWCMVACFVMICLLNAKFYWQLWSIPRREEKTL